MKILAFYTILVCNLYQINAENTTNVSVISTWSVKENFGELLNLLKTSKDKDNKKIKELEEKLAEVDSYAIDIDKYGEILRKETKEDPSKYNSTGFYNALLHKEPIGLVNDSRNLYLKLKQRMNRDDVLDILAKKGPEKVMENARRMMENGGAILMNSDESDPDDTPVQIDDVLDKYLGEPPNDTHKFSENDKYSPFWDPQTELEEKFNKYDGRRIYKGERVSVRSYPFMVSIHVMGRFWCGGVIFWKDLVITSASCLQLLYNNRFYRENPNSIQVRVGSNHSRVGGELIEPLEVFFHPSYDPKTLRANIALIRLSRHLKMSSHRVPKYVTISKQPAGVPFTARVKILGWGVKTSNQKVALEPIFLQAKTLPVYPNKMCKEAYGEKFVYSSMFCAGTITTGEGACNHDAGGPAILDGKLVGIISFGPPICGFPDTPTVFTLVGAFSDWIESVNESMPTYYQMRRHTTTTTENYYMKYFTTTHKPRSAEVKEIIIEKPVPTIPKLDDEMRIAKPQRTRKPSLVSENTDTNKSPLIPKVMKKIKGKKKRKNRSETKTNN